MQTMANADERADVGQIVDLVLVHDEAPSATTSPVTTVVMCGVRYFGWILAAHPGSSPSRAIAKKMRGCPYWKTSSTAVSETTAPNATIQLAVGKPGDLQRPRQRIGRLELLIRAPARSRRCRR